MLALSLIFSVSFSLHCFTSSPQSFAIPFVGGVGPQIKSSQCIWNKGQRQRTAETKGNRSKRIGKWRDSCSGTLHLKICGFYFEMLKCVVSNSPPTQQTVQRLSPLLGFLNRKSCLLYVLTTSSLSRAMPRPLRSREEKNHYYGSLSQSASRWRLPESQDGVKRSSLVYFRRAIGCCVEVPQDGNDPVQEGFLHFSRVFNAEWDKNPLWLRPI